MNVARDLLRERECDIVKGVPVSPKVNRNQVVLVVFLAFWSLQGPDVPWWLGVYRLEPVSSFSVAAAYRPWLDCCTKERSPRVQAGGSCGCGGPVYRLTWTLVPPPGAPRPASPVETTLTQSESWLL